MYRVDGRLYPTEQVGQGVASVWTVFSGAAVGIAALGVVVSRRVERVAKVLG